MPLILSFPSGGPSSLLQKGKVFSKESPVLPGWPVTWLLWRWGLFPLWLLLEEALSCNMVPGSSGEWAEPALCCPPRLALLTLPFLPTECT